MLSLIFAILCLGYSPDFENYQLISDYYIASSDIFRFGDVGFAAFVFYFSSWFESWHVFFALVISLSLAVKFFIFSKLTGGHKLSLYYSASLLAVQDVIQIRTGLATTLFLLAYYFWSKKKLGSSICYVFSVTFQMSTAILMPMVFIAKYLERMRSIGLVLLVIASFAISEFFFHLNLMDFERVSRYIEDVNLVSDIKPTILSIANIFVVYCIGFGLYKYSINPKGLTSVFYGLAYFLSFFLFYDVPALSLRVSQLILLLVVVAHCEIDVKIKPIPDLPILLALFYAFPGKHLLLS